MGLQDLTRPSVEAALDEFRQLGRRKFLSKYGFREARSYFIQQDGVLYESEAVAGAAHGKLTKQGPLSADEFSGREQTAARVLKRLGFTVTRKDNSDDSHKEAIFRRNPTWTRDELLLVLLSQKVAGHLC